jgi:hypothetical protein
MDEAYQEAQLQMDGEFEEMMPQVEEEGGIIAGVTVIPGGQCDYSTLGDAFLIHLFLVIRRIPPSEYDEYEWDVLQMKRHLRRELKRRGLV